MISALRPSEPPLKYDPSLDGLRGIAVVLVMLFHAGYLPFGWVGVQMFFVLSGFLISSILLNQRTGNLRFDLARFYWRRSLRILPVLAVLLTALSICFLAFGFPPAFDRDLPLIAVFGANFARVRETDLSAPLVHLWSLAVEEQFYLLWPFAMLLLPVFRLKRLYLTIIVLTPVLRAVLFALVHSRTGDSDFAGRAVYVLPFTQFDAFVMGAALGMWPSVFREKIVPKFVAVLAITGVCGIAVLAWLHLSGEGAFFWSLGYEHYLLPAYGYIWGYTFLNVLFALLIALTSQAPPVHRAMKFAPLAYVGRISYGVYVYHLPIFVALDMYLASDAIRGDPVSRLLLFALGCCLTLMVSSASYQWVEKPMLALKDRKLRLGMQKQLS